MKNFKLLSALLLSFAFMACGKIESTNIEEKDLYLTMALQKADENSAECYVRFSIDNALGSSVELAGQDQVYCNGEKMRKHRDSLNGDYTYYAKRISIEAGEKVVIQFQRPTKTYESVGVVPSAILLTSPQILDLHFDQNQIVQWIDLLSQKAGLLITLSATIPDSKDSFVTSSKFVTASSQQATLDSLKSKTLTPLTTSTTATLQLVKKLSGQVASGLSGHFDLEGPTVEISGTLRP